MNIKVELEIPWRKRFGPGVGIRAARPGPKTSSPNRAEPDFGQPDRAEKVQPDPAQSYWAGVFACRHVITRHRKMGTTKASTNNWPSFPLVYCIPPAMPAALSVKCSGSPLLTWGVQFIVGVVSSGIGGFNLGGVGGMLSAVMGEGHYLGSYHALTQYRDESLGQGAMHRDPRSMASRGALCRSMCECAARCAE